MKKAQVEETLEEMINLGFVEVSGTDSDGTKLYKITNLGKKYANAKNQSDKTVH